MGNGEPLSDEVLGRLVAGLQSTPNTFILLAWADEQAIGIATCFRGFSTFLAKPLINIHDLAVLPEFRGQGVARRLLDAVINEARASGCGRVTLEVRQDNSRPLATCMSEVASDMPSTGGRRADRCFISRPFEAAAVSQQF